MSGKTFCVSVALEPMIRRGAARLDGVLQREDGTHLTGQEAYDALWQSWLDGFKVLPVCDNHGPDGHCLGHAVKAK